VGHGPTFGAEQGTVTHAQAAVGRVSFNVAFIFFRSNSLANFVQFFGKISPNFSIQTNPMKGLF
jgi:hypothetical protein